MARPAFDAERTWPAEHAAWATRGARSLGGARSTQRGARGLGARCAEHAVFVELARRVAAAARHWRHTELAAWAARRGRGWREAGELGGTRSTRTAWSS